MDAVVEAPVRVVLGQEVGVLGVVALLQGLQHFQVCPLGVALVLVHGVGKLFQLRDFIGKRPHVVVIGLLRCAARIAACKAACAGADLPQGVLHRPLAVARVALLVLLIGGVLLRVVAERLPVKDLAG